ncbi:hypothetical protein HDV03_001795 [Kappamyces sp. JEL0829]|nr:hypothetical protein HDV03_001795 [Kappamyces sp. JEL0829]
MTSRLANDLKHLSTEEFDRLIHSLPQETIGYLKWAKYNQELERETQSAEPILANTDTLQLKTVEKGISDADLQDKIWSVLYILIDGYKAAMACLFVIFVPQLCPADSTNPDPIYRVPHQCTDQENALSFNFITLFFFVCHYCSVWIRENFLIEYFDDDKTLSKNHLCQILPEYPKIELWFHFYNRIVSVSGWACVLFSGANVGLSAVICFRDYYSDYRTVTVFVTNLLLLVSMLYRSFYSVSRGNDRHNPVAISGIQMVSLEYNTIDQDHLREKNSVYNTRWYFHLFGVGGDIKPRPSAKAVAPSYGQIEATAPYMAYPDP